MIIKRTKKFAGVGGLVKGLGNAWSKSGALGKTAMVAGGATLAGGAIAGGKYVGASKKALEGNMGEENGSGY